MAYGAALSKVVGRLVLRASAEPRIPARYSDLALAVSRYLDEVMNAQSREDAADGLREQAASCRRLAKRARTSSGLTALRAVADQFDTDASRIDPRSLRR